MQRNPAPPGTDSIEQLPTSGVAEDETADVTRPKNPPVAALIGAFPYWLVTPEL